MERWKPAMLQALAEAAKCGDDVPVGAVLVDSEGRIVAPGATTKNSTATQPVTPKSSQFARQPKPKAAGASTI